MKKFRLLLGIIAMLCAVVVNAQTKKFEATVVDELGEPCIGASVVIKGTTTGVMTNVDGSFAIDVPAGAEVEVSYIGYITQTISNFSVTQIVLEEDRQQIEEVVVVGYGVQKKSHLTGSVATVPVDDIQDLSSGNLASTLSGLVNGVSVSGGESRPGESASISIRNSKDNMGAFTNMVQGPLYVIDGYIYPNDIRVSGQDNTNLGEQMFNNLDPASIESISVLKDASAAVYGSRAANGVILVTTKKGKVGAPSISYSGNVGIADSFRAPKMLSAYQYGKLWNAVRTADDTDQTLDSRYDLFQYDELNAMKKLDYNLLKKYWSAAITHKHSINITGATEKVNYFGGISYFNQDGNLGKLDYDRWTFRAGVDVKITKGLKAGISVSGDYGKKTTPLISGFGSSTGDNDYTNVLTHPRYIPEYVDGKPMLTYGPSNSEIANEQRYHFGALQNGGDYRSTMSQNLNVSANIEYDFSWIKPLQGLRASFSYAKSIQTNKTNEKGTQFTGYSFMQRSGSGNHLYTPIPGEEAVYEELLQNMSGVTIFNGQAGGYIRRDMDRTDNYQMNFTVNYARDFGKHSVGALFSIERSETESEFVWARVSNPYEFGSGQANSNQTLGDKSPYMMDFSRAESGSLSYIGRVNYAYDDKYLIELLLRSDASTKFAPENYWGLFPSVSAGWVISKEQFMQNVNWLDFLKLRASFGLTGRDNVAAWQWAQFYESEAVRGAIFGETPGQTSGSRFTMNQKQADINRNSHWDKSYKMNIGIDWNVLNNRLGINLDYYNQWDREILTTFNATAGDIPGTIGTSTAMQNYGKLNSWGVELTASWRDKVNEDFSYRIQLNTGYNDNKALLMAWQTGQGSFTKIQPGGRTDTGTWGMECIGMFRSYPQIDEYVAANNITKYMGLDPSEIRPGMLIYKDIRGTYNDTTGKHNDAPDGNVNTTDDLVKLSNRANPYSMTANLGFDWKGLSLTAQISAQWGGYYFLGGSAINVTRNQLEYTNMPSFWNTDNMFVANDIYDANGDLVVEKNTNGYYPNLAFSSVNATTSSFWRYSGARVSLQRVTLAYTLPKKWTNAIGISSCRINVTGQNLCHFYNPLPDKFIDLMDGTYGKYPTLRKITIGLNLTF